METPCARFDDLSPEGSGSFGLIEPVATIVARRLDDVIAAMEQAEQAAREGLWVAGFVSYEAAPAFNPILTVRPPGLHDPMRDLPLARFQTFRERVELDRIDSIHFPAGDYSVSGWTADSSTNQYRADLASIGRAIMAGEGTQLKHTFRLHAAFSGDPAALYRDLLLSQRGPHAAYVDVERYRIVSASPEGFFRRLGNSLALRPVLASMERGRWLEEDLEHANLLRVDGEENFGNRLVVKEIEAELSEVGTLIGGEEPERFWVERFETLWHLVTEVKAELRPGTSILDIFRALFPSVSITGVPKIEAMNLVAATEDSPRGVYCGAIGFMAPSTSGDVDASFSVGVRTVVVDQEEGVAQFGVGSPITNRSDVVSAYEEARLKAKVLVDRRPEFRLVCDIRCVDGRPLYLDTKLARLANSAQYFGFELDRAAVGQSIVDVASSEPSPAWVTVLISRHGQTSVQASAAPAWHEGPDDGAVAIGALARRQVSSQNVYLFHRTTNRKLIDRLARKYPHADVVIVCNELDEVAGAVSANVVVSIDGVWITPPVAAGTVPTAFRHRLLSAGTIVEGTIAREKLVSADAIGVIDDVHGWRVVGLIE